VIILTPGGDEFVARRKTIMRRQTTTVVWRVRVERREQGRPLQYDYRDLPDKLAASITRWRPLDVRKFPGPLPSMPARIEGNVNWQSLPEPPVPIEPEDDLEWSGDYSTAPNISKREVEVRVLRGLRTERSLRGGRGDGRPGGYRDSTLIVIMRGIGKVEYEHVDETRIAPTAAPWQPSRRDIGDELTAIGWLLKISRAHRELAVLRSLNPP
jgi:hypothetical protein